MHHLLSQLLSDGFMPHGNCFLWRPSLVWLHVISDGVTALSYFSIPVALIYFVRKRGDMVFNGVFIMFAGFILLCGLTHIFEMIVIWEPYYYMEGVVKAATAAISLSTAILLWFLMPTALRIPTPSALRAANERLSREVVERRRAEESVREANRNLENLVAQRTEELEQFVYAASHDLQEPLRQLSHYTEFLKGDAGGSLPEAAAEDLGFIGEASARMSQLVDSLLSLSHASRQELAPDTVRVGDCIAQATANLDSEIRARQAVLEGQVNAKVAADRVLLTTVYQNLISNALKYSDEQPMIRFTANTMLTAIGFWASAMRAWASPRNSTKRCFSHLSAFRRGTTSPDRASACRSAPR